MLSSKAFLKEMERIASPAKPVKAAPVQEAAASSQEAQAEAAIPETPAEAKQAQK